MIRQASRKICAHSARGSTGTEIASELERAVALGELARVDDAHDDRSPGRSSGRTIPCRLAGLIEDLLVVGRELEFVDPLGERLFLAGLEVEPPERRLAAPGWAPPRNWPPRGGCSRSVPRCRPPGPRDVPASIGNGTTRPAIPSRSITTAGFSLPSRLLSLSLCNLVVLGLLLILGILGSGPWNPCPCLRASAASSSLSFKSGLAVALASVTR